MMETKFIEQTVGYEAPQVEVVEVMVEQGFAASPGGTGDDMGWG